MALHRAEFHKALLNCLPSSRRTAHTSPSKRLGGHISTPENRCPRAAQFERAVRQRSLLLQGTHPCGEAVKHLPSTYTESRQEQGEPNSPEVIHHFLT